MDEFPGTAGTNGDKLVTEMHLLSSRQQKSSPTRAPEGTVFWPFLAGLWPALPGARGWLLDPSL